MNINIGISTTGSLRLRFLIIKNRLETAVNNLLQGGETSRETERRFSEIIKDYGPVISGVCFSYATTPEDLKDLRQDILINIWKGLEKFRGDSSISTWIYRVALNTCVSTVRKRSKRIKTVEIGPMYDRVAGEEYDPEPMELLHRLISGLSPLDKAVITMWLDERSYEEIAEVTGITRGNVAVRINRIKQRLKEDNLSQAKGTGNKSRINSNRKNKRANLK